MEGGRVSSYNVGDYWFYNFEFESWRVVSKIQNDY